jgi:hypothetical protein
MIHIYGDHLHLLRKRIPQPVKNIVSDEQQDKGNDKGDSQPLPSDEFSIKDTVLISLHDVSHGVQVEEFFKKGGFLDRAKSHGIDNGGGKKPKGQ